MKKQRLFRTTMTALTAFIAISLFAQDQIILNPKYMVPADTGYYIGGAWKDLNDDDVDEFYNECTEEFGGENHNEAGVQFGFTYNKSMIMPTCFQKDIDDTTKMDHSEGYIQLDKTRDVGTDSAVMCYIITPPVTNLVSLTLEVSTDNTRTNDRPIDWLIEYSKDNGETWENSYIIDGYPITDKKYGETFVYDGSEFQEFGDIKTASQEDPIVIRIMSRPQVYEPDGSVSIWAQRLRVHYVSIVADKVSSINNIEFDLGTIRINNNTIYSDNGTIEVFNTLGQFMGSGEFVSVQSGIYIVRNEMGATQKVLVK